MATWNLLLAALATHSLSGCSLLFEPGAAVDGGSELNTDAQVLDGSIVDASSVDASSLDAASDAACAGSCPNGYARGYSCLCYKAVAGPSPFLDSKQACRTPTGGNLVIIDSEAKNTFVKTFIAATVDTEAWIGLEHGGPGSDWTWVDGTFIGDYHAFGDVNPPAPAVARCASMILGQWVNKDCGDSLAYVCQAPAG